MSNQLQTQQDQGRAVSLASMRAPAQEAVKDLPAVNIGFASLQSFELIQRVGNMFSKSTLVPKEYHGNVGNCVIAVNMAARVGADPLMVMQNLVIVHGRPTWSSQFLIATVNTCGRFSALRFEFFGEVGTDGWGCRAWAIEKATGEKLVGTDVTIAIAKSEGWYQKNGSKWKTIPQQMLMYRAGSWWTRAYAPELSMGLHTQDEMQDVYDAQRDAEGNFSVDMDALRSAMPTDNGAGVEQTSAPDGETLGAEPETSGVTEDGQAIDAETGEVKDVAEIFDLSTFDLETQEGTKEASKAMQDYLGKQEKEERPSLFAQSGGSSLLDAISKHGLGMDRSKFKALGLGV